MPSGVTIDQGFLGAGDVMVRRLDDDAAGFRPIGNTLALDLTPKVATVERKSMQLETWGQTLETVNRMDGLEFSMELDTFGRENMTLALAGNDADLTQSALTAEEVTLALPHGEWVELGALNVSAVTIGGSPAAVSDWDETSLSGTFDESGNPVTVGAGTVDDDWTITMTADDAFSVAGTLTGALAPGAIGSDYAPINPATGQPYFTLPAAGWGGTWDTDETITFSTTAAVAGMVEDEDFIVKPEAGMIMALADGDIADGAETVVTFNAAAIASGEAFEITGGAVADVLLAIRMDGKNFANNRRVLLDVWRVRVSAQEVQRFLTQEFNKIVLKGLAETPEDKTGPFRMREFTGA